MSVVVDIYNFPSHKRGTTFDAKKITLTGKNITGATIVMKFKPSFNSQTVYEFKTSDNSILLTAPLLGEFEMQSRIIDVPKGVYKYDCFITFSTSNRKSYFEGIMEITDSISG